MAGTRLLQTFSEQAAPNKLECPELPCQFRLYVRLGLKAAGRRTREDPEHLEWQLSGTDRTRADAASAIAEVGHWSSQLRRREFASEANFPRPVIGGRDQPPDLLRHSLRRYRTGKMRDGAVIGPIGGLVAQIDQGFTA